MLLYPTCDVDQRYRQSNIYVILPCMWLGQYHPVVQLTTSYSTYQASGQTQRTHLYLLQLWDTYQLMHPNQCCMDSVALNPGHSQPGDEAMDNALLPVYSIQHWLGCINYSIIYTVEDEQLF